MSKPSLSILAFLAAASNLACPGPEPFGGSEVMLSSSTGAPDDPSSTGDTPTSTAAMTTTGDVTEAASETASASASEPGTGSATGGGPQCGNGILEDGEACDDGDANHDNRHCKTNCQLNVCGDGKVLIDEEQCDDGLGNGPAGDAYGFMCTTECARGAWCGDGKLQPEFEACDLGPNNGSEVGDAQGILCDATCQALRRRGFVTSQAFSGDLGGLFGADQKCQQAAKAGGLAGFDRFRAYLSTSSVHAKDRFTELPASWPLVSVTGKKLADSWTALLVQGPAGGEGLAVSEVGTVLYNKLVATNTAPGGQRFSPVDHCHDWTSAVADQNGRVGLTAMPPDSPDLQTWKEQQLWINFQSRSCKQLTFHLYCIED